MTLLLIPAVPWTFFAVYWALVLRPLTAREDFRHGATLLADRIAREAFRPTTPSND